jgi:hypothetical protein
MSNADAMADLAHDTVFHRTTINSFGHPILKYCQRIQSTEDSFGNHLFISNNAPINEFLDAFLDEFCKIDVTEHRQTVLQNLIITQALLEVSEESTTTVARKEPIMEVTTFLDEDEGQDPPVSVPDTIASV